MRISVFAISAGALLALAACGGGTPAPTTPAATAPPATGAGTVQGKPAAEFYTERCSACHGTKREGAVGPSLIPGRLTSPDDVYVSTIKKGRTGTAMPAFAELSDNDVKALVSFLKNTAP